MGIFDFLKHDKKHPPESAEKAGEQLQQQMPAADRPSASGPAPSRYADMSGRAPKEAAERMTAEAPPMPAAPPRPTAPPVAPTPPAATAATGTAAPAAAPVATKRTYIVRAGDSLAGIARSQLGNEARWRELYATNRGVIGTNPEMIHPGMVLTLPN
ncbi:LysM peptidoglycan-binding domain-containing protein [Streptomyces sp. NPDC093225]|uniref:LysM peptidoglycan-binding domain-containing protein n=1 Tax=Streptomyces sp. NPDC093225 TaxID=3366034 RepID=UPI00380E1FDA